MNIGLWSRCLACVPVSLLVLSLGSAQSPKAAPAVREHVARAAAVAEPAQITSRAPQGLVTGDTQLQVGFDRPIVALGVEATTGGFTIATQPALKGQLRWSAPNLLVFDPESLALATHYTARLEWHGNGPCPIAQLQSVGTWSFDTPGPELEAVVGRDEFPAAEFRPLVIRLSQPVAPAELASHLRVSWSSASYGHFEESTSEPADDQVSGNFIEQNATTSSLTPAPLQTPIGVRVERGTALDLKHSLEIDGTEEAGNRAVFLVYPRKPWPLSALVTLELLPGLRGQLGPVVSRGSKTQVYTEAGLRISGTLCAPDEGCVLGDSLSVDFGTEVAKSELAKLRFEPRPSEFEMHFGNGRDDSDTNVVVQGVFLAGQTYQLTVPADLRDTKGHRVGNNTGGKAVTLLFPFKTRPLLAVEPKNGVFALPERATIGLQTRFLSSVALSALRLSDEAVYQLQVSPRAQTSSPMALPLVATRSLVERGPNGWAEEVIDLDALMRGKRGMFAFEASAAVPSPRAIGKLPKPAVRYYQRTDLAPIAWVSPRRLAVLALRHSDLKPVSGVDATLFTKSEPHGYSVGRTDADGTLAVSTPKGLGENPMLVVGQASTDDRSYARLPEPGDSESSKRDPLLRSGESVMIHAWIERDLLRPGDGLHVLGWALIDSPEAATGLRYLPAGVPIKVELWDGDRKLASQNGAQMDAFGKFYAELQVPRNAGLGHGHVLVSAMGKGERVSLHIEDVRPPTFEVKVKTPESVLRGQPISVSVSANQLSGEATTIASMSLRASCSNDYRAPIPLDSDWEAPMGSSRSVIPDKHWSKDGPFAQGHFLDSVNSAALTDPDIPSSCSVDADVTNLVREHIGDSSSTTVHPAPHYLAMRRLTTFDIDPDEPLVVVLGAFDTQGKRVSVGAVELNAITVAPKPKVVGRCWAHVTAERDAQCNLGRLAPGDYTLVAKGRRGALVGFQTSVHVFEPDPPQRVTPEPTPAPNAAPKPAESLELRVPDKRLSPGDRVTASISATNDGYGLLIVERSGIREQHPFVVRAGKAVVPLIVKESWVPHVEIEVAMPLRRSDKSGIYAAHSTRWLHVRADKRILQVKINAPAEARPGTRVPIDLSVRDSAGHPQPARLAIWAVDEAYLQLTGYEVVHPLSHLVPQARHETRLYDPFADIIKPYVPIGSDPSLSSALLGLSGIGDGGGGRGEGIGLGSIGSLGMRQRTNFKPVPLYIADVATNAAGQAQVTLPLPDDLTRFRITALAAASMFDGSPGRFGKADSEIRVTQPVVLRAAMPRLLRPSDHAEVAAIAKNLTPFDGVFDISARLVSSDAAVAQLVSDGSAKLPVHAGEEVRVPFQVEARSPGNAKLELTAVLRVPSKTHDESDALLLPLVVEPEPAVVNRSAVYLTLQPQEHKSLAIRVPPGTLPGGGVTVNAATSLLAETLDAAAYLVDYPHGCAEQTSSAILGLLAYRELRAHGVSAPVVPDRTLQERVARLLSMQTPNGGFAYWPGEHLADDPHVSPYATWVLAVARKAGVAIPERAIERARKYVSARLSQVDATTSLATLAQAAFAVQALVVAGGQPPPAVVEAIYGKRAELDPSSLASLLLVVHALSPDDSRVGPLVELLSGAVLQTPGAARVTEPSKPYDFDPFASSGRTHALVTLALSTARPEHPLVNKLARGLLDLRAGGRWRNTQENAFALLVAWELVQRESRSTHARLRAVAGASTLFDGALAAAADASARLSRDALPVSGNQGGSVDLMLDVFEGGPVHVRVASEWNMAAAAPRSAGIELKRMLTAKNGTENLTSAREGDTVWCNIELRNHVPLHYVAVTLPLPAGVEGTINLGRGGGARPAGETPAWVSHEEIWKDRIVLFADTLEPGKHFDALPLRVVTPGDFVVPAAVSEAMYEPEIQAITPGGRLRVVNR